MKTLILLRHAKSTWDDPVERDFDRPLNPRGRRAARAVGCEMKAQRLGVDVLLASPARRVVETLDELSLGYGRLDPIFDERLYLAPAATLLEIARAAGDEVGRLMLVGHNPGLEALALLMTQEGEDPLRRQLQVKYPTGTLAELSLNVERWREVGKGCATLSQFIRPRDLDAELGPDEDSD